MAGQCKSISNRLALLFLYEAVHFSKRKESAYYLPKSIYSSIRLFVVPLYQKRILIAKFCITSWLVYLLNNLKRQDNIRYLICLSIPKKFNLSVIIKKQKTILFRKRFPRFQVFHNISFSLSVRFKIGFIFFYLLAIMLFCRYPDGPKPGRRLWPRRAGRRRPLGP